MSMDDKQMERYSKCSKEAFSLGRNEKNVFQEQLELEKCVTREQKVKELMEMTRQCEERKTDLMQLQTQRQKLIQVESATSIKRDIAQNQVCVLQKEIQAIDQQLLKEAGMKKQLMSVVRNLVESNKQKTAGLEDQLNHAAKQKDEMEGEVLSLQEKQERLQEQNVDDSIKLKVMNNEQEEEKKKAQMAEMKLQNIENTYEHQKEKYQSECCQHSFLQTRSEEVEGAVSEISADIQRKKNQISSTEAELSEQEGKVKETEAHLDTTSRKLEAEITDSWHHKGRLNIAKEEYDRLSEEQHRLCKEVQQSSCSALKLKSQAKSSGNKFVQAQQVSVTCELCKAMMETETSQPLSC